ncbi:uncharacterized protein ACRADG_003037 isoform 1-T2 [Cochliomyia hominivorax]
MSAAGIKVATTTTNPNSHTAAAAAAAVDDVNDRFNTIATTSINENDNSSSLHENVADNSSFCNLPSLKEQQALSSSPSASSLGKDDDLTQNKVPLENPQQTTENEAEINDTSTIPTGAAATSVDVFNNELNNKCHLKKVEDAVDNTQLSPGLSLLQQTAAASSPPPHSYRHSRAYRHFKNPPQPHMCIRTTTEGGEELFINVLSWTRIVIPQEPSDPIPLYGGMRVPPGSPRSPPIVFAVMANPEVLKDSGRHSKDPEERRAMVELMCDFVEAMNPGVKLVRNAVILKDRDISGELKDVWNAVQAQRDREREEQLILQRQQHQQHFHNMTNATTNGNSNPQLATNHTNNATTQQMFPKAGNGSEAILMAVDGIGTPPRSRKIMHEVQTDNTTSNNIDVGLEGVLDSQMSLALLAEHLDNKISMGSGEQPQQQQQNEENHMQKQNSITNDALSNGNNSKNSITQERGSNKMDINNQLNVINCNKSLTNGSTLNCNQNDSTKTINATSTPSNNTVNNTPALNSTTTTSTNNTNSQTTSVSSSTPAPAPTPVPVQQAPTKKEKLGGFLPNGCIFPRFTKNNKHKDKDKEKEKETKTKDKEKNVLLSALKKSKDKKSSANVAATAAAAAVAHLNQDDKNTSSNSNNITTANNCINKQQQKNCLQQLESGVQKLDINNHQQQLHTHIQDKNINNTNAANNTNNTTTNNITGSGVGVH